MIRVTIELLSAIDDSRSRTLGVAIIANDRAMSVATDGKRGDYDVALSKWEPKLHEVWKRGRVVGFDRVKRGPWDLLYLALKGIVGRRNQ